MTQNEIDFICKNNSFIKELISQDPVKLLFKHGKDEGKKLLIGQIASRQRIKKKLPSWYDNYNLIFLPGLSLEQSSSEDTATLKAKLISGKHLLDITGGLGVDSYFLSHNFEQVTYLEQNPELFKVASHNLSSLSKRIKTLCDDGLDILKSSDADVVYIDPYRRDSSNQKMVSLADCEPNVLDIQPLLTQKKRTTYIKASPMLSIHSALEELQDVSEVWIISNRNECKEVIFKLQENQDSAVKVRTFNLGLGETEKFEFELSPNVKTDISFSEPLTYLYEPNASILKSGGQDFLAKKLALNKLHPNSNFFTSSEKVDDFPGKSFEIIEVLTPFHPSLKKGRFNVISRNFPKKANEIEKKLKLLSHKEDYLLATKTLGEKHIFIKAKLL
ncbi:THUMP-like domain-containing protein [Owenweeksia hongkongensis]|uniref:class I SAM-dependent methyltransferase n=1 Tax=Owenweeksia hongkongensis TaxID=253245 RepID=UPI003A94EFF3